MYMFYAQKLDLNQQRQGRCMTIVYTVRSMNVQRLRKVPLLCGDPPWQEVAGLTSGGG